MPKLSPAKQKEVQQLEKRAKKLYGEGLTQADIAAIVGRSIGWVSVAIKKLSTDN